MKPQLDKRFHYAAEKTQTEIRPKNNRLQKINQLLSGRKDRRTFGRTDGRTDSRIRSVSLSFA